MIEEDIAALEARIQQCYIVVAEAQERVEACVARAEAAAMRAELATSQSQMAAVASEAASIVSVAATEQALEAIEEMEEEEEPMPIEEEEHGNEEEASEIPLRPNDEEETRIEPGVSEPILIRVEPEREPDKPQHAVRKHKSGLKRGA